MQATLARLNDLPAPDSSTALTTMKVPAEQQQAAALAQALALQRLLSSQRPGSGALHLFHHLRIRIIIAMIKSEITQRQLLASGKVPVHTQ